MSDRATVAGDSVLTILASHASAWTFGSASATADTKAPTDALVATGISGTNGRYTSDISVACELDRHRLGDREFQDVYVWKTNKAWAQTCRLLPIRLRDGTDHVALFKFQ